MVLPLPSKNFHEIDIDAIYYDTGIRIMPESASNRTYTIHDLLKLSNGAKNIYLFTFNVQKRKKFISLPDSFEPYQAIRDWKRENNLFTFPLLIQESEYEEQLKKLKFLLKLLLLLIKNLIFLLKLKLFPIFSKPIIPFIFFVVVIAL
ncbi:hypothetical protein RS022_06600 [Candidatus Phytoplasma rubi]|uniref:Uncharacterized protein n=1 Tax=Candidatus Phytoplasma rubi TaxID=399025 RepID=A0ABY7BV35_9MOLU|nr:hypothetical protein [Candidatus Phytoplasma rubi]WAN63494.1 hypothetical protein RS022_06600 [Candidatus Phytoplasma rubi]